MATHDSTQPTPASVPDSGTTTGTASKGALSSSGWLGAQSPYEQPDQRKLGRAMMSSLGAHGALFLALVIGLAAKPVVEAVVNEPLEYKVIFRKEPGPGGGGGGSPAPAPKKELEIPKHKTPPPTPVVAVPVPVPVTPPPPVPTLNAPIETNLASVVQSSGTAAFSFAPLGGGGRGGGVGSGQGNGVGEGTGGGFGGGAYQPGSGVSDPQLIKEVRPNYTSEAMRAKIQGQVELEAVVEPNGTITRVRVMKSLDKQFGLDAEAMLAAKKWLFRPGYKDGKPVPVLVTLILEFRLH
jgi:TonB family protein